MRADGVQRAHGDSIALSEANQPDNLTRRQNQTADKAPEPPAARGSTSVSVSTMTRTAMKGRWCVAALSATAALSISTAAAPVSRNAAAFSAGVSIACVLVSRLPSLTAHKGLMAAATCSRHAREVVYRPPSATSTSPGITTLPGLRLGSRPPAMPKVMSDEAPASTKACAPAVAGAGPRPLNPSNDPSPSKASSLKGGSPPRGIEGPKARASDASAATTPTELNDGAFHSMCDSAPGQIPVGGQRPQGEIGRIAVIAQIKHAREPRRRIAR